MGSTASDDASITTVVIHVDARGEFVWQGLDRSGGVIVRAGPQQFLIEVYDEIESIVGDDAVTIIDTSSSG